MKLKIPPPFFFFFLFSNYGYLKIFKFSLSTGVSMNTVGPTFRYKKKSHKFEIREGYSGVLSHYQSIRGQSIHIFHAWLFIQEVCF